MTTFKFEITFKSGHKHYLNAKNETEAKKLAMEWRDEEITSARQMSKYPSVY